jgi:hypothetical protein
MTDLGRHSNNSYMLDITRTLILQLLDLVCPVCNMETQNEVSVRQCTAVSDVNYCKCLSIKDSCFAS